MSRAVGGIGGKTRLVSDNRINNLLFRGGKAVCRSKLHTGIRILIVHWSKFRNGIQHSILSLSLWFFLFLSILPWRFVFRTHRKILSSVSVHGELHLYAMCFTVSRPSKNADQPYWLPERQECPFIYGWTVGPSGLRSGKCYGHSRSFSATKERSD